MSKTVNANDIVLESLAVNGANIGMQKATELFNQQINSCLTTHLYLSDADKVKTEKYINAKIWSTSKKPTSSDHVVLQVARDFTRLSVEASTSLPTTSVRSLFVGSTMREIKRYGNNPALFYHLYGQEDKDNARSLPILTALVEKIIRANSLPLLKSNEKNQFLSFTTSIDKATKFLAKSGIDQGCSRIITTIQDSDKFSILHFQDSLYNMTADEVINIFKKTGAYEGHAVLFYPNHFIDATTPESNIYNYKEGDIFFDHYELILKYSGPLLAILSSLIPQELAEQVVEKVFFSLVNFNIRIIKDFLKSIIGSYNPIMTLITLLFDTVKYRTVLGPTIEAVKQFFLDIITTVTITWKNGFQNGYYHNKGTWVNWLKNTRFYGKNFVLDREIVTRFGEMYHIKFSVNDGTSTLVSQLSISPQFHGIRILDFINSWDKKNDRFGDLVYMNVFRNEWFEILTWALGEDIEALDINIVITAITRLKAGLSISSTELVASWYLADKDILNMALIVLIEVYRINSLATDIVNNKEFINRYENNITTLLKNLGKGILNMATLGLPLLALNLYYWMTKNNYEVQLVDEIYESPVKIEAGRFKNPYNSEDEDRTDFLKKKELNFSFQIEDIREKTGCEFCALCKKGTFGKQELECVNPKFDIQEWSIGPKSIMGFYTRVLKALEDHEAMNAHKCQKSITKLKEFLQPLLGQGFKTNLVCHNIEGGPGTGKSVIGREVADIRRRQGYSVAIISPFSELLTDYSQVTLLDGTKVEDFIFKTTYRAFELSNINVLIIEEKGAFDVELLIALAAMTGAKEVIIIGDGKQTILQDSEGFSICRQDAPINLARMSHHKLVYNFRNNPYAVKVLNDSCGYNMLSFRTDYKPFEFVTIEEFKKIEKDHNEAMENDIDKLIKPIEKISFNKKSIAIFGSKTDEKNTVRSKQGRSYGKVAIALTAEDEFQLDVHGMLIVAISRSRDNVYFVCPASVQDNIVNKLKMKLKVDTEDKVNDLITAPWPTIKNITREDVPSERTLQINKNLLEMMQESEVETNSRELSDFDCKLFKIVAERSDMISSDLYDEMNHCFFESYITRIPNDERSKENVRYREYLQMLNRFHNKPTKNALNSIEFLNFLDDVDFPASIKELHENKKHFRRCLINNAAAKYIKCNIDELKLAKTLKFSEYRDDVGKSSHFIHQFYVSDVHCLSETEFDSLDQSKKSTLAVLRIENTVRLTTENIEITCNVLDILETDRFVFEKLIYNKYGKIKKTVKNFEDLKIGGFRIKQMDVNYKTIKARDIKETLTSNIFNTNLPSNKYSIDNVLPKSVIRSKALKFGKDGYRFSFILDKSNTFKIKTGYNNLNVFSGVNGAKKVFKHGSRLLRDKFLFNRTAGGKIKKTPKDIGKYAITVGYGNEFNGTPVDTLIAGQRYLTKKKTKPYSLEGVQYARKLAEEFYHNNMNAWKKIPLLERNAIINKAFTDMDKRKYYKRGVAEIKKTIYPKLTISFHNRKIFKPIKDNKLNLLKGGQGIAQTPSWFNHMHCPTMRVINSEFHRSRKSNFYYDNLEPVNVFRKNLTTAINKLPIFALTGITDAEEFDANQNWFTIEIEKHSRRLQGVSEKFLKSYYRCREPTVFRAHGLFSGKTNGEKGSGFLDTLLGNTNTSVVLSDKIIAGVGPKVIAGKGDDFLKVQCGIKKDLDFEKTLMPFTNLKFKVNIGEGGEFCGDVVSREGCFPSITRAALKALAARSKNYKDFTEKQISYRDKVSDILICNPMRVVASNMYAEKKTKQQVLLALNILVSLGHISKSQWDKIKSSFGTTNYQLSSAKKNLLPIIQKTY